MARSYWKPVEFQLSTKRKRSKDSIGMSLREKKPEQFCPVDENWGILPKRVTPKSKRGGLSKAKEDGNRNSRAPFKFPDVDPTYALLGFSSSTFFQEEKTSTKEEMHIYSKSFL
ncbi:hypothetical protein JRQ81_004444 [Phrynocephalus forsythii]|uniref:Uncharacterized protein n=1 Tax=Phrynocephalus forsythii TaxID=171643 RepID=A0A9Q1AUL5_9SAUR|nr:hypothetical protein JRQ81_004444 [Phrynocephalus forsythii]